MTEPRRLMAILAHPDDESLGVGGTLAHYAAQGVETYVISATRGERGRYFDNSARPSDDEVGRVRARELHAAVQELGVRELAFLDYRDQELDQASPREAISRIVHHLRRVRPQVVITFGQDGAYGHPDHIAISQFTTAACIAAADTEYRVAKLYYNAWPERLWEMYQRIFKRLVSNVDGIERQASPWPEWMLTTLVDASAQWPKVWSAIQKHETQMAVFEKLGELTPEQHSVLWGEQYFYRAASLVNGGRQRETDLFEGL